MSEEKSWFKKALEKYDAFCEELGVNKGNCRGCVPVVKFDPEHSHAHHTDSSDDYTSENDSEAE